MFRLVSASLVMLFAALALADGGTGTATTAKMTGYGINPERIAPLRYMRPAAELPQTVYATAPATRLLTAPALDAPVLRRLPRGAALMPIADSGPFLQVRDPAGEVGYVSAEMVAADLPA